MSEMNSVKSPTMVVLELLMGEFHEVVREREKYKEKCRKLEEEINARDREVSARVKKAFKSRGRKTGKSGGAK